MKLKAAGAGVVLLIIEAVWVVGVFPIFLLTGQVRRERCAYLTTHTRARVRNARSVRIRRG
jgi:hypothetical protein